MANDTTTKVTDLNEAEQVAENDVFLLTHSNGLSEKVTAETLFKNGSKTIVLTRAEYDALGGDYKQDAIYAISDESTGGINVDQTYDPEGVNPLSGQAVNGALMNCLKNPKTISFIGTVDMYNGFYVPNLISDYVFILRIITNEGYICEPVYQTNTEVRLEFGNAYGFPDIAQNTQVAVNVVYIDL